MVLCEITTVLLIFQLDLETPTTADIPLEGQTTSDIYLTPRSDSLQLCEKEFISSDGFSFPIIVDDEGESEIVSEDANDRSPENSPSKSIETGTFRNKHPIFNVLDGSYSLENFDPFGIKDLHNYSTNYFTKKMDMDMCNSPYSHPAIIMEEVKKSPKTNIFDSHFNTEEEDVETVTCDNIATLTACLQRSVMLPLTYQLEVVNDSILTYFLVNLDMYEHLRSLKDYFFLMDGEFSRSICHNLFTKLAKTLNPQELLNFATLHNILDKALGSSISRKFLRQVFNCLSIFISFFHDNLIILNT